MANKGYNVVEIFIACGGAKLGTNKNDSVVAFSLQ